MKTNEYAVQFDGGTIGFVVAPTPLEALDKVKLMFKEPKDGWESLTLIPVNQILNDQN